MTAPGPLPDLPSAITRGQVWQALEVLGLPPDDLVAVRVHMHGVEIDLFARNEDGQKYVVGASGWRSDEQVREYEREATHRVCIPVVAGAPRAAGEGDGAAAEASP